MPHYNQTPPYNQMPIVYIGIALENMPMLCPLFMVKYMVECKSNNIMFIIMERPNHKYGFCVRLSVWLGRMKKKVVLSLHVLCLVMGCKPILNGYHLFVIFIG